MAAREPRGIKLNFKLKNLTPKAKLEAHSVSGDHYSDHDRALLSGVERTVTGPPVGGPARVVRYGRAGAG